MAVEAARDALTGRDRATIAALRFASTTYPFLDRLHSGIVAGALNLSEDISAIDVAATQRAGTSALIEALGERQRDPGGRLREARRPGRQSRRDDERRRRRSHPRRRGQADRHAAGQGLAHDRFRRPLPLPRQPVRLPVGGALDPRRRLHDRSCRRPSSACLRAGQGAAKDVTHFCMPADAGAWPSSGRQGGRYRRQGGVRSAARQLRRHRRRPRPAPAGRRAREGQGRRQDHPGRLRPGCRRAAVRGDARDRQAAQEPGRRRSWRGARRSRATAASSPSTRC